MKLFPSREMKHASYATKTEAALTRAAAARASLEDRLAAHKAMKPTASDLDGLIDWRRKQQDIEFLLDEASATLQEAEGLHARALERAAADAAAKEEARLQTSMQKLAKEHASLTLDLLARSEAFAADLGKMTEMARQIAAYNKGRDARTYVVDGEVRVRQRMGKPTEAVTDTTQVWVDKSGTIVKAEVWDERTQRYVKNPAAVRQEKRTYFIREAIPAQPLPFRRLVDEVRLVDKDGNAIWPPVVRQLGYN